MLDLTIINDLIPNILKHLSYEYHILFLKYIDSDDRIILNNHRSYIFCQLLCLLLEKLLLSNYVNENILYDFHF